MALSRNAKLGIGLTFASIALSITLALTMGSAPAAHALATLAPTIQAIIND